MNDRVLEILMRDYEIARAEDRQYLNLQGVLITLWLTAVGVLGVFAKTIHANQAYPQYMIALAPSLIICLAAFTHWLGTQAVVRSLYMRALERKIRERLRSRARCLGSPLELDCFGGCRH